MKKPKRGRKKTEAKEVNKANALLDLINEVYDGMGDMAELAEWAEILADDYNIDIDDENMETDEIMLTAFNKMNDNDFRNEVDNFIESLSENDFKGAILPDHPTPISVGTHTRDNVPIIIFDSTRTGDECESFDEEGVKKGSLEFKPGHFLIKRLIDGDY